MSFWCYLDDQMANIQEIFEYLFDCYMATCLTSPKKLKFHIFFKDYYLFKFINENFNQNKIF